MLLLHEQTPTSRKSGETWGTPASKAKVKGVGQECPTHTAKGTGQHLPGMSGTNRTGSRDWTTG
jgi:hypothetical protein